MADSRPVCFGCFVRMEPRKNGVRVLNGDGSVQSGDLYECPRCGCLVVTGFGEPYCPEEVSVEVRIDG